MKKNDHHANEGEAHFYLSTTEVITSFGTSLETIIEIVNEGIVPFEIDDNDEWLFDSEACRRIRLVLQLNHDLGVNVAGAALVLELLHEIEHLETLLANLR